MTALSFKERLNLKPTDDFYIPKVDEVRRFAEDTGLNPNDVEEFLTARCWDEWTIPIGDEEGEAIRNWKKFLTDYCKNVKADRRREAFK
jgi:hypothetical protein